MRLFTDLTSKKNTFRLIIFSVFILGFFAITGQTRADTLGDDRNFLISATFDAQSRSSVKATLRKVSDHAYFYIEDSYWNSVDQGMRDQILSQTNLFSSEFDSRIYPIETSFFGSEPNPGVDNDPHITILLSPLKENAGGYFDTNNQNPQKLAASSNEREMIYLNIAQINDLRRMESFLSHEFQHLITFNQKDLTRNVTDDIWLNELRSEYAVSLLGYNNIFTGSNIERRLKSFTDNPTDSLTEWKNLNADYGQITMFGEYVAEHWTPKVLSDTLKSNLVGIASLNQSLSQNGFSDSFYDVFKDWLIANFLNDASLDPKFGYTRDGLKAFHVNASRTLSNLADDVAFAVSDSIKDWEGRWYDIQQFASGQNNFLKINFSSPSLASFYVPYIIFKPTGERIVGTFNPVPGADILYLGEIGKDLTRVVLMPIKKDKIGGFTADETPVALTFTMDRVKSMPPQQTLLTSTSNPTPTPTPSVSPETTKSKQGLISDGTLIRAKGDRRVYIVQGKWRRHIISSKIFNFYRNLGFDKVMEVSQSVLDKYTESNLVRYSLGKKIYEVDESGKKHWLNMTGQQFSSSGRSWDSIFQINQAESTFYKNSSNITR